LAMRFLL